MSVYFVGNERGHIKIGHAVNPWARLIELQCGTSERLNLLRVIDGGQKTESWLHRRYASRRIRGEWFHAAHEMLTVVTPDEIPIDKAAEPERHRYANIAEYIQEADRLGLLSADQKKYYAPVLEAAP